MSNDTALSIVLTLLLALTFMVGLAMGYMRRDTEVRRANLLADIKSAEMNSHWETAIRD